MGSEPGRKCVVPSGALAEVARPLSPIPHDADRNRGLVELQNTVPEARTAPAVLGVQLKALIEKKRQRGIHIIRRSRHRLTDQLVHTFILPQPPNRPTAQPPNRPTAQPPNRLGVVYEDFCQTRARLLPYIW
jgi:hypothetical protein